MKKLNQLTVKQMHACIGIYKITISDKEYIGSSCNIKQRLKQHLWDLNNNTHHNRTMQKLYTVFGIEQMYFEIVEECCENLLIERETYYITTLKPVINHILNPQNIVRDITYLRRLKEGVKKSYEAGRKPVNLCPVHMYSLNNEYLKSFESLTEASLYVNAKSINGIKAVCQDKASTANGYKWSYNKVTNIESRKNKYKYQSVLQYTLSGIFIKKWDSMKEAAITLNITNINRAISKNLTAGGYKWKKA